MKLDGKKIAILVVPKGTEEPEFAKPKEAVERAGAETVVVSFADGEAQTVNGDLNPGGIYRIDKTFDEVSAVDFDGIVIPGGTVGADRMRANDGAVRFIREFFEQGKPIGAICHGPWTLVEAGVLNGRTLTSFRSLKTDIENAHGRWVDEEVVTDQGLVTSRTPKDLEAFCSKIVEEFAEGRHASRIR